MKLWERFTELTISKLLRLGGAEVSGNFRQSGHVLRSQAAPETATDTATLTDAQMLAGIIEATPTAGAAYTVRTGAQLEQALRARNPGLKTNDYFDLTIINLGATTLDITLTAATGITIVGNAVVRPGADSGTEQAGQGTFRFRNTATDTFIAYRVS